MAYKLVIISSEVINHALGSKVLEHWLLRRISLEGLIQFAITVARDNDYETLRICLSHDLLQLGFDRVEFATVLHSTMDLIGEIAAVMTQLLTQWLGVCDHTVRFETFSGGDLVVSIIYDDPIRPKEGMARDFKINPAFGTQA